LKFVEFEVFAVDDYEECGLLGCGAVGVYVSEEPLFS
jgi:hypothetical protein